MKAVCTAVITVALIGLAGVASSQAQTNVTREVGIALKGKLTPSGATVTGESLSGNTNGLAFMETDAGVIIGQFAVTNGETNVSAAYLVETSHASTTSGKSVNVYTGTPGPTSRAVWLVDFAASSSSFSSKISGIWIDGTNAVTGTVNSIKPKK